MTVTGGRRQRLVADSVYHMVDDALEDLGWKTPGRLHVPITFLSKSVDPEGEIAFNTLVLSQTSTIDQDAELGSNLGEITTTFYLDFYAANDSIGKELIFDVRDILRGRHPTAGRTMQTIDVYDWSMATPTLLFSCDVEDVVVDKAHDFPKAWQRHWWSCRFDVVDAYD